VVNMGFHSYFATIERQLAYSTYRYVMSFDIYFLQFNGHSASLYVNIICSILHIINSVSLRDNGVSG